MPISTSNRILKSIESKPLTLKQIYKILDDPTKTTIRGRVSELLSEKLVKKSNGTIVITSEGKAQLKKLPQKYNLCIIKDGRKLRIWAENWSQAQKMAKLIYSTNYEVNHIE